MFDLRSHRDRRPTLKDVVDFVGRAATVMSDPVYGSASMRGRRVERTPHEDDFTLQRLMCAVLFATTASTVFLSAGGS